MFEFFRRLFISTDFMPHGHCYLWQADILWLTVLGDGLTGMAYFSLPFMLFYIIKERKDLAHRNVFVLFGCFIMACGATHFIDIWTIWFPTYRIASMVTMLTGIISVLAAVTLYKSLPGILAMPSTTQLESTNLELRREVTEKENAQAALRQANDELESRVQKRTAQLIKANRELEKEIEIRKKAERDLINKNGELIRINGDLDNFVYCASHDLKSPVANAEGLVTALREELPEANEEIASLITRLEKAISQMHRTIWDLSEVSNLERKTDVQDFNILPFEAVLDEVKLDLTPKIKDSGAEIKTDFTAVSNIYFTHKNLKSILFNLVSNAIKYRSPDRKPSVSITTADAGNYIVLTVADNGIGIDLPKHEKKIFSLLNVYMMIK